MKVLKVAVTGHRPQRIKGQQENIKRWLAEQIKYLSSLCDKLILIDGMAQGVDQIAALVAIECGVQIWCYFPYKKKLYGVQEYIVDNAAEVRYICDKFQPGCYITRDRRMVQDCDVLLGVWDGKPWGGTYLTLEYAEDMRKDIILYPGYKVGVVENGGQG